MAVKCLPQGKGAPRYRQQIRSEVTDDTERDTDPGAAGNPFPGRNRDDDPTGWI